MARLPAGVRRTSSGLLEKRFTIDGIRYSVYGKTTQEIADKEKAKRELIAKGSYTDNSKLTVDKYFSEWVDARREHVKGTTLRLYKSLYKNHIKQYIGNKKLVRLERRELVKLQNDIKAGAGASVANESLKVVKAMLNDAVKDEIITRNPALGIKNLKKETKASDTIHRALTEQEQATFMQEMRESYYYNLVAFLLCTGLRIGEACALTWGDIDEVNKVIHIKKTTTFTEDGKRDIGTTKTEAGTRDIPINDTIKQILSNQKKDNNILPFTTNYIFITPYGVRVYDYIVNKEIKNTLQRLEDKGEHIEHFTCHALRDTFATRYIEQGGSMQTLKTLLGHSSLSMTMDLYAHVLPNTKAEEMARLVINI